MGAAAVTSGKILTHEGEIPQEDILKESPVLAYYFSAHWCPPCRKFTPVLADMYKKWNTPWKRIEIVFVSSDQSGSQFQEYFNEMPWVAIPFGDQKGKDLSSKFGIRGIPALCIVSNDGTDTLLTSNGRDDVQSKGEKALDEWKKLYTKK